MKTMLPRHWFGARPPAPSMPAFLEGGGAVGALIAKFDWSATSVGPVAGWPAYLRNNIAMILRSHVPIVTLWNEDGVMIYNDAYSVFAGGRHPQLLGSKVREGWPEVADFNDNIVKTVLAGGTLAYREQELTLYRTGAAEQVWLNLDYSPVVDEQGRPVGVIAIVIEATEKVRAERYAAGERERLRQMFEQAPAFMSMKQGPEHRFALTNRAYARLIGGRELIGKTVREAIPEAIEAGLVDLLDDAFRTGEPRHATALPITLRRDPDAPPEERFLDLVYQPVRDDDGNVVGIFAQGSDVTARVQAERLARRAALDFQAVAQAMPNHVWTAQPDGAIDWVNERTIAYTGEQASTDGKPRWRELVHPEDVGLAALCWEQALRTGETYEVEFRIRRHDGAYRWHLARAVPVRDAKGEIERWIGTNTDIHDRKLAETESTRDRNRIWSLSQELMLVCDLEARLTGANPAVTRLLGWEESEVLGRTIFEFLHPDDQQNAAAELHRLAQGATVQGFEARCSVKGGGYRIVNWTAVPDAGRIHAVGRDITVERAALRERDRTWALSPVVKVVATRTGELVTVNPAWTKLLGWEPEDSAGSNVLDFIVPEDREIGARSIARLAEGQPVVDFQNTFLTRSGERRRLSWTTVPENGLIYGFGRDITAEHEAAAALAASMAERDRIWTTTNDLMGTGGIDGYLKAVNPAWTRLLGFTREQLRGIPYLELVHETDRSRTLAAISRLAEGRPVRDFEVRVRHEDGQYSLIAWSAEPAGELFHMVGRDVTEQRTTEEALRQSQKMEAVGQLTGGIAHDFNNLLQGITGSLDLLQKRITQGRLGELNRFITGAMGAANRASALTHRLLAFSRRQPLDPRPVRANPLVASMEDLLRRTLGERVELELVLGAGLWLTLCDANQLENAILNLAINGRDAMPDGGKLTIETTNTHIDEAYSARLKDVRPGQYVCICVSDTGMGMSQETIDKAFEPFFTTKPIGQGTGLGLSMIYGFARQSEGNAKIYSELGRGTTVKLYLPRHRGEGEQEDRPVERRLLAPPESAGETVLVIEDEPVVRGLIVEVLNDLGYAALEASDGPMGLEILQSRRRIDLLVSDIGLPGLNGRQVADAARLTRPELKVLFMTGYAENAAFASGFLEPGMAMITKPFAMEALAARVRNIIEEPQGGK
jgi:PAS domain S-box-containing protein